MSYEIFTLSSYSRRLEKNQIRMTTTIGNITGDYYDTWSSNDNTAQYDQTRLILRAIARRGVLTASCYTDDNRLPKNLTWLTTLLTCLHLHIKEWDGDAENFYDVLTTEDLIKEDKSNDPRPKRPMIVEFIKELAENGLPTKPIKLTITYMWMKPIYNMTKQGFDEGGYNKEYTWDMVQSMQRANEISVSKVETYVDNNNLQRKPLSKQPKKEPDYGLVNLMNSFAEPKEVKKVDSLPRIEDLPDTSSISAERISELDAAIAIAEQLRKQKGW